MLDVSIVIISFNTRDLTLKCIKSLLDEGSFLKIEIIIVDNASSDYSVEEIQKLKLKIKNYKLKLKVIENKVNLGFSIANNQGIKIAKGNYILLLNSDTIVKKGSIAKLVQFAENTSDAGVVGPKLLNTDGSPQPSCFNFPTLRAGLKEFWFGKKGAFGKYLPEGSEFFQVDALVMAAFLITPKALKKVGLLNERYFMYFEDFDYCRKVWQKDLKVYYLPKAEVIHYHGASGNRKEDQQRKRLIASSKIYHGLFKYYLVNFIIWSGQKWQNFIKNHK
ncbi:hypothetical protein A2686_00710 [Candidatus Woesebacteria bacterium RIFCSPHIGHO2_01_FULL_38_10]|uniref:Glycosyltransferase 2-like domain-containing protein n=1 Tax=Candidatus Woesebacteria bacterium RIFCSPLOWO2_01_FULL_39_10b TaxID=1802517 RepID=A0A1F8B9D0_9BACT|nr:MAG: hypothetical protein A2686_00710 [Candidatus Woesebacteria bacterium RIFCSPHIGHO2_01_FULL_38_10]OGM60627.1 MAG: hypothetical protein A2892_01105 [Candidatus Woesebacteria bacterium RIFCSPLOWO2_01_FULL_39_10b]